MAREQKHASLVIFGLSTKYGGEMSIFLIKLTPENRERILCLEFSILHINNFFFIDVDCSIVVLTFNVPPGGSR